MAIFNSYVKLPEGTWNPCILPMAYFLARLEQKFEILSGQCVKTPQSARNAGHLYMNTNDMI